METNYKTIPFDLERALRIQEGKEAGEIVTRNGYKARIICTDRNHALFPIVCLIDDIPGHESSIFTYTKEGYYRDHISKSNNDLFLKIPDIISFKDGDILVMKGGFPFVYRKLKDSSKLGCYVGMLISGVSYCPLSNSCEPWCSLKDVEGYATEEQKQVLLRALQDKYHPFSKEYIKRFFGIEHSFLPFEKVLVRNSNTDFWTIDIFKNPIPELSLYCCVSNTWNQCIPYNKNTKHLFNTDKAYE